MPLTKLAFKPGVNREGTVYSAEGSYYACDKIRFRSGYPEKIGGWMRDGNRQFTGIARNLINWITLNGSNLLGIGTHLKYMIGEGQAYTDITPIRATSVAGTTTFAAVNGSAIITVTDPLHGASNGDFVTFSGAVTLGGDLNEVILNAEFQLTYIDINSYTITAAIPATAGDTGNGGAAVVAEYQISVGLDVFAPATGWGAGPWTPYTLHTVANPFSTTNLSTTITYTDTAAHLLVTGDWVYFTSIADTTVSGVDTTTWLRAFRITVTGATTFTFESVDAANATAAPLGGTVITAYPDFGATGWGSAATQSINTQLRLWGHDIFGEDLIFNVRGGNIYYYDVTIPARAVPLSSLTGAAQAPTVVNLVLVSQRDRHVIAFGSNNLGGTGAFDPLQIRWSDTENAADWSPTPINTAGDFRVSAGSRILTAIQTRQEILIWTDSALYSMQFIGPPLVFSINLQGSNSSLVGPNAVASVNGVTYWMGVDKFYQYAGTIQTLPCTLRQYIFDDIEEAQSYQIFAGTVEQFNEIWWFYPSAGSTTVDRYVIYNYVENLWYYGTMARTAWVDSRISEYPLGADYNSRILFHECEIDDQSGTVPVALESYIESSDFDIGDGDSFAFVRRILPDMNFLGSVATIPQATMTLYPRAGSGAPYKPETGQSIVVSALSPDQQYTNQVFIRIRGRQMKLRIDCNTVGVQWQLGTPRLDIRPDGRKL